MNDLPAFIYVFSTDDKNELEQRGYKLLRANEMSEQYIFALGEEHTFSDIEISYVLSDVLMF